jgi:hypothetical protein
MRLLKQYDEASTLGQWYSTLIVRVPPDVRVFLFNFVAPKLLVHNSSNTKSIMYI